MVWPDLVLLLRFRIHRSELGTPRKVVVKLATEDGATLMNIEGDFTANAMPDAAALPETAVNHILRIQSLGLATGYIQTAVKLCDEVGKRDRSMEMPK